MLQELVIHDFAIIETLTIDFNRGMTVLTGETGAGKSIIIDAVGLLAGGRGSADFIRTGAKKCTLEGLFVVDDVTAIKARLETYGIPQEDDTILVQRDINQNGRSSCRINGHLVNTTILKHIGEMLVDIHGQNEHQELMYPEKHLGLLDHFAQKKIKPVLKTYQTQYAQYKKLRQTLKKRQEHEQEWAQRLDILKFQTSEIEAANLQLNEEDQLITERDRLENFQRINESLASSYQALNGDEQNTIDRLGVAMSAMQDIAALDPAYGALSESIDSAFYELQDAASEISRQLDSLSWDEGRLDSIEKRLETLTELKHKYGQDIAAVLKYYDKIKKELDEMENIDADNDELTQQVTTAKAAVTKTAAKLSKVRHQAGLALTSAVQQELADLYMDKAKFSVVFLDADQTPHFMETGQDSVEFYIQTNPGETSKPLAKIASGGELSRIMLAIKTIFSRNEGVTSIIFDEVDTGVSGRVAQAIANKIEIIGQSSQVLCITHLPQVAAMADFQLLIQKQVQANRTTTSVTPLVAKERVEEIARMIAGTEITALSLEHAHELLRLADVEKEQLTQLKN
ncbi:DNA repair protein RecN [Agrilactobacillus yilanensis]|uniref:DNA repair protein RecN n=1 Tax=Agrilactobacillus yilanensis TaxID=2485997 RepID=A0ABW4JBJ0_9LACO|nr:DNA repair protein RecN [Agrilactobacillus yilanensis]